MNRSAVVSALLLVVATATAVSVPAGADEPAGPSTAWRDGRFAVDVPDVVRSSDIVVQRPNLTPQQSMPLGNGTLGAAVWSADGFTAQLNRADTLPDRKSPGWLVIPGLAQLTNAPDFTAHVDLYDATYVESGGGMTATTYVDANSDQLIVDVTGANGPQTAQIHLWSGRSPQVSAHGPVATLAETWTDDTQPGSTGRTFGSLAALTAGAVNVQASTVDSETAQIDFTPHHDGSYRVVVAAPSWHGGDATAVNPQPAAADPGVLAAHEAWWHRFWNGIGLVQLGSADGAAQYLENLRTLDLYIAAASSRSQFPGSQAGVADLFSPVRDDHQWDPGAYWHWNLRMYVEANLGAGAFDLNAPYFRLYRDNLANIEQWTSEHMGGRPGICVPETMRFNGQGIEYETWLSSVGLNCDASSGPYYNARTITTGAEVGLWIWQQYEMTGDRSFLAANYPVMAQAARFLLAYASTGADGLLHTYPSNAHETQWDVHDPTTDIAAEQALFPAVIGAARVLNQDPGLAAQLTAALPQLLPLPRTDAATQKQLLPPSADASGADVIAPSYDPAATKHNSENIGLEAVWPYGLIGDDGPLSDLAQRTFAHRPNVETNDWSNDPIQAARLGLGSDMAKTLVDLTEHYQQWPNGLATFVQNEPYGEQQGVVAAALNESLVQDYDGLLRIAPAIPSGWDAAGTVFVQGGHRVSVQVSGGQITTVGINAGSTGTIHIRNPWPGRPVEVVDGGDETTQVVAATSADRFDIPVRDGRSYLVQPVGAPVRDMPFAPVTAVPATEPKSIGSVTIGLSNTSGALRSGVGDSQCLDVPGAKHADGTPVEIWTCSTAVNQHWTRAADGEVQVYSPDTKCLSVLGGPAAPGSSVGIESCAGQQWTFQPDHTIRTAGLCLEVPDGATQRGTFLDLGTCTGTANQRWTFQ
jgi:ricin-type beta-trefoil lectin protein/glycosyl hydrolase family 95